MFREVLFAGDDVLAYGRAGDPAAPLVITFGAIPPAGRLERAGFGDKFLADRQINALHVVPLKKQWYQTPEMAALLPLLQARRAGFGRCVLYGSSMGAYASLLYAARLDADGVIAFAPQMSIDPRKAPFDPRWRAIGQRLCFLDDEAVAESQAARGVSIFYDPFHPLDRRHALAFARDGVSFHPVPFAGHQVGHMLLQTGCLDSTAAGLIHDDFDWAPIRVRMRAHRSNAQTYWRGLFVASLDRRTHPRFARIALDGLVTATKDLRPRLFCTMARVAQRKDRADLVLAALEHAVRHGAAASAIQPLAKKLVGRVPEAALAALYAALPDGRPPPRPPMAAPGMLSRLRDIIGL